MPVVRRSSAYMALMPLVCSMPSGPVRKQFPLSAEPAIRRGWQSVDLTGDRDLGLVAAEASGKHESITSHRTGRPTATATLAEVTAK